MRAHHEIGVPVAAGIGAIRPDAADLRCKVEDELRLRIGVQPLGVCADREVVVLAAGHERVEAVLTEPADEV